VSYRFDCVSPTGRESGIARAVSAVAAGELIVLPTDAVYGLGCDAFSPSAVTLLAAARGAARSLPPPVFIPHARTLDGIATGLGKAVRELVDAFWPGPLTLLCQAQPSLDWDLGDTFGTVSVRMPLHPLALQVLERTGPLAVTAASPSGRPAPTGCEVARDLFGAAVTVYLDAGPLAGDARSTIVDVRSDRPRVLRAGAIGLDALLAVVPDLDPGVAAPVPPPAVDETPVEAPVEAPVEGPPQVSASDDSGAGGEAGR
jgi:tRNA threonylcarbamoyl adenosine modification protein (Sua5/YciO/YrdC/YwlC family)